VKVNNPKNGLLWCSAIEFAYEERWICFSYDRSNQNYHLHVLMKEHMDTKLADIGEHRLVLLDRLLAHFTNHTINSSSRNTSDFRTLMGETTLSQLIGRGIKFSNQNRPMQRALMIHATYALKNRQADFPDYFVPSSLVFDLASEFEMKDSVKNWLKAVYDPDLPNDEHASQSFAEDHNQEKMQGLEKKKNRRNRRNRTKKPEKES